eukprot:230785_1
MISGNREKPDDLEQKEPVVNADVMENGAGDIVSNSDVMIDIPENLAQPGQDEVKSADGGASARGSVSACLSVSRASRVPDSDEDIKGNAPAAPNASACPGVPKPRDGPAMKPPVQRTVVKPAAKQRRNLKKPCCSIFWILVAIAAVGLSVYFGIFYNRDPKDSVLPSEPKITVADNQADDNGVQADPSITDSLVSLTGSAKKAKKSKIVLPSNFTGKVKTMVIADLLGGFFVDAKFEDLDPVADRLEQEAQDPNALFYVAAGDLVH